jgi:hypothetical protein
LAAPTLIASVYGGSAFGLGLVVYWGGEGYKVTAELKEKWLNEQRTNRTNIEERRQLGNVSHSESTTDIETTPKAVAQFFKNKATAKAKMKQNSS